VVVFTIRSLRAADRVGSEDGRIVLENSSGQKTTLTQTGRDADPWISPDGRIVVFLRHPADDMFRNSVYEIDVETRAVKLLYAGPAKYGGREGAYFGRPELDESNNRLFLMSNEHATSGTLISIELASGQAMLISDEVVGYDIIECPKEYRGDLIALKRQERDVLGRPYFLYYLYSAAGFELGLAGGGELDSYLDYIRGGSCEETEPALPVSSHSTSPLRGDAIRIESGAMDRQLITRIEPTYPSAAESERIQGDVRLEVRIAVDGTILDVNLVSGPPQLVQAAMAAVRQWRYRPTIVSGHPVPVVTVVNVPFRLPGADK
jgi:TonB family protein